MHTCICSCAPQERNTLSAALAECASQKVGDDACSTATEASWLHNDKIFGDTDCAFARAHTAHPHPHARDDEARNQGTYQLAHVHAHTPHAHAHASCTCTRIMHMHMRMRMHMHMREHEINYAKTRN